MSTSEHFSDMLAISDCQVSNRKTKSMDLNFEPPSIFHLWNSVIQISRCVKIGPTFQLFWTNKVLSQVSNPRFFFWIVLLMWRAVDWALDQHFQFCKFEELRVLKPIFLVNMKTFGSFWSSRFGLTEKKWYESHCGLHDLWYRTPVPRRRQLATVRYRGSFWVL